jgi:sugar O-acyltransferase (sialic acid O-acetyltransferase NeuD family)
VSSDAVEGRFPPSDFDAFVALSYRDMNRLRAEKYSAMRAKGYRLASYISTRCSYLSEEPPGDNAFILEDNTVQPFVKIGANVTLWSGNHIGHDSVIEDHCFISSHVVVSGHVRIGSHCFLGVNATLRNGITLAAETLVGAGAVVMKDTANKSVYLARRAELFSKTSDQIDL